MNNRKYLLKKLIKAKRDCKEPGVGEWRMYKENGLVATRWVDKYPIYFLSNAHLPEKEGISVLQTTKTGERVEVKAIPSIVEYN